MLVVCHLQPKHIGIGSADKSDIAELVFVVKLKVYLT